MPKINPLILGAGAVGLYLLLKPGTSQTLLPGQAASSLLNNSLPQSPQSLIGINSGVLGSNGTYYTVSNYAQLAAAVPNLMNPNYFMTPAENAQYVSNYLDLQQALPTWIGSKQPNGTIPRTVADAAQVHWQYGGCAQKRIFLPLQPPSMANQIPPPPNPKASGGGGSWISTALNVAGSVAIALLGPADPEPQLTDQDVNVLITGSAILKKILPFYLEVDPKLVVSIENKIDSLVLQYAN